jgi:hypothetical protein
MNHFRQYLPNFMDPVAVHEQEFDGLEELLRIPCVARWREMEKFETFQQQMCGPEMILVAFFAGDSRWVVGYLRDPVAGLVGEDTRQIWRTLIDPS